LTLDLYWLHRHFDASVLRDSDSHPIPPGYGQAKVHRAPPFMLRDLEAKVGSFGFHFRSKPTLLPIPNKVRVKDWLFFGD